MKALTDSQIMFLHESICKFGVQLIQVGRYLSTNSYFLNISSKKSVNNIDH